MTLLSQQLRSNASVTTSLAVQQLPEFGVIASSIRSVTVSSATIDPIATANGTAYLISIQMTVLLVGLHSGPADCQYECTVSLADYFRGCPLAEVF